MAASFLFSSLRLPALCAGVFLGASIPHTLAVGDLEEDWKKVTQLDTGPQAKPRNPEEAREVALGHLDAQEKALREFLGAHSGGAHFFEARLRLSRLLQIRGSVEGQPRMIEAGRVLLEQIATDVKTPEERVEVDFARVTLLMRTMRAPTPEAREGLLAAARKFQADHPEDRRVAALLSEVALLFPLQPKVMRSLLLDAQSLSAAGSDAGLKGAIADNLKRLDLLGQPLSLAGTTLDGKPFDLARVSGSVSVILFFARWSKPSLDAMDSIKRDLSKAPGVNVIGVSLDPKAEAVSALLKEKMLAWPVLFDGKGWQSPTVRALGINALPTVWLVDKQGRLRSLNALESTLGQVRQLQSER